MAIPPHHTLHVPPSAAGTRLDVYLAQALPDLSRSRVKQLIEGWHVLVNGKAAKPSHKVADGEEVTVTVPAPEPTTVEAEAIPLEVVYEDADLLVINKPRGMVTHPAPGSPTGTLVNAVLAHCTDLSGVGGEIRPGIVHRLDKDTSGLLVVAKHDTAHLHLARQIQARTAQRHYLTLVYGDLRPDMRDVDAPIGRHPIDRKRMAVMPPRPPNAGGGNSRPARTTFIVQERFGDFTFVEARLHTGRTHQIRVHAAHIGHPVVGDPVYGQRTAHRYAPKHDPDLEDLLDRLGGQALHAHFLTFVHPRSGEALCFHAPLPEEIQRLLDYLRTG